MVRPFSNLRLAHATLILLCITGRDDFLNVQCIYQLSSFVGGGSTADHGGVPVEVSSDFLQRGITCLNVEEPDHYQLDGKPHTVEDVVLPANVIEGDGVDVLVEENCQVSASSMP